MTDQTCNTARGFAAGNPVAAAVAAVARVACGIRREMEIARARRALEAMPDSMLRDIGIDRYQIDGATRFGRTERERRPL